MSRHARSEWGCGAKGNWYPAAWRHCGKTNQAGCYSSTRTPRVNAPVPPSPSDMDSLNNQKSPPISAQFAISAPHGYLLHGELQRHSTLLSERQLTRILSRVPEPTRCEQTLCPATLVPTSHFHNVKRQMQGVPGQKSEVRGQRIRKHRTQDRRGDRARTVTPSAETRRSLPDRKRHRRQVSVARGYPSHSIVEDVPLQSAFSSPLLKCQP